jgi:hypothetical protein
MWQKPFYGRSAFLGDAGFKIGEAVPADEALTF